MRNCYCSVTGWQLVLTAEKGSRSSCAGCKFVDLWLVAKLDCKESMGEKYAPTGEMR